VVLADTVGFIADLPHELVAAFRATLQETTEAGLLLHVIDAASPQRDQCVREVEAVLAQIGAAEVPQIQVLNKIDLLDDPVPRVERDVDGRCSGSGCRRGRSRCRPARGALTDFFHREAVGATSTSARRTPGCGPRCFVRAGTAGRVHPAGGWEMDVELPRREFERLRKSDPDFSRVCADGAQRLPSRKVPPRISNSWRHLQRRLGRKRRELRWLERTRWRRTRPLERQGRRPGSTRPRRDRSQAAGAARGDLWA